MTEDDFLFDEDPFDNYDPTFGGIEDSYPPIEPVKYPRRIIRIIGGREIHTLILCSYKFLLFVHYFNPRYF